MFESSFIESQLLMIPDWISLTKKFIFNICSVHIINKFKYTRMIFKIYFIKDLNKRKMCEIKSFLIPQNY